MEIMSKPIGSVLTSVPSTSPTKSSSLPPRRARSYSPFTQEVLTDSEAFSLRVDPPAPSSKNCSRDAIAAEPSIEVIATMDWREAEKAVVNKCEEFETKLNFYTPDDIDRSYNEAEFYDELEGLKESYCEADESIGGLLSDHGDSMPTQQKEHWTRQATEILQLMKSHERQLRAAATKAKGNIATPVSNASASEESTASELTRGKREEVLSKMKTLEESIESKVSKLQENIYRVRDERKQVLSRLKSDEKVNSKTKLVVKTGSKCKSLIIPLYCTMITRPLTTTQLIQWKIVKVWRK